jgi:hypothetical protein
MNHARRRGKIVAHQPAPFLEVRAAAKMNFVIFEGFPFNHQAIRVRLFNPAFQPHRTASAGTLEQGGRQCDAGLELLIGAWFDQNLCNFGNHVCVPNFVVVDAVYQEHRKPTVPLALHPPAPHGEPLDRLEHDIFDQQPN